MDTIKKDKVLTKEKLGLKTGLFTALGLIIFFMLMKFMNLIQVVELRFFNIALIAGGVLYALNRYRNNRHIDKITYLKGLSVGFITALVAAGTFAFFMLVYLINFDSGLLNLIKQDAWFGEYLTPSAASFAVFLETASAGSIFTFICMQFLKKEPYSQSYHKEIVDKKPLSFSGPKTVYR